MTPEQVVEQREQKLNSKQNAESVIDSLYLCHIDMYTEKIELF